MTADIKPRFVENSEATVRVDISTFCHAIRLLARENIIDEFETYLIENGLPKTKMEVVFANSFKNFLLSQRIQSIAASQLIECDCSGDRDCWPQIGCKPDRDNK